MIPIVTQDNIQKPVEIEAVILKSGRILNIDVKSSSLSKMFDRSAMNAILLSAPLPSLPEEIPYKQLEARFVFTSFEQ